VDVLKTLKNISWIGITLALLVGGSITFADAAEREATIGYQKIPGPWIVSIVDRKFEKATGYKIRWVPFDTGARAMQALAQGKIDIAHAGSSPIAAAASVGVDLQLFWIVNDINQAEALVVRRGSGIIEPQDLRRKTIGVPFASTTHFHLLFALEQFGIAPAEVKIVNLSPGKIEQAWKNGTIDGAFIWNPALAKLTRGGKILISSGTLSGWGKATFDGLVVDRRWARNHETFMVKFTKTIAAEDRNYRQNRKRWYTETRAINKIAEFVGIKALSVPFTLSKYGYPSAEEQISSRWLGGGKFGTAALALEFTSKFLRDQNVIGKLLPDYSKVVTDRWATNAAK
jgi:taurine transport system substrate-binding protein